MGLSVMQFFFCILILVFFLFVWGKCKLFIALKMLKKGKECIKAGDYAGAVRILQNLGSDLEMNPEFWYCLGLSLANIGSVNDASDALSKAVEADPSYQPALRLIKSLETPLQS